MLDNGVSGFIFPDVNTAAEASGPSMLQVCADRQAFGRRRHPNSLSAAAAFAQRRVAQRFTLVVCMIETREGPAQPR